MAGVPTLPAGTSCLQKGPLSIPFLQWLRTSQRVSLPQSLASQPHIPGRPPSSLSSFPGHAPLRRTAVVLHHPSGPRRCGLEGVGERAAEGGMAGK